MVHTIGCSGSSLSGGHGGGGDGGGSGIGSDVRTCVVAFVQQRL